MSVYRSGLLMPGSEDARIALRTTKAKDVTAIFDPDTDNLCGWYSGTIGEPDS